MKDLVGGPFQLEVMLPQWQNDSFYGDGSCSAGEELVKKLQPLLRNFHKLASELGIPYILNAGSLLGAWRNGKFIPWDSEMDLLFDGRFRPALNKSEFHVYRSWTNKTKYPFYMILQEDWDKPYDDRKRRSCSNEVVDHYMDYCSFQVGFIFI